MLRRLVGGSGGVSMSNLPRQLSAATECRYAEYASVCA
ncbi:Uncharacterised protein [Mycobacteroides abscessus subsp. abscessus]|nr:Uncharacterised protein [Mycobacteroides abscessus subsp. abscessus]